MGAKMNMQGVSFGQKKASERKCIYNYEKQSGFEVLGLRVLDYLICRDVLVEGVVYLWWIASCRPASLGDVGSM